MRDSAPGISGQLVSALAQVKIAAKSVLGLIGWLKSLEKLRIGE